MTTLPQAYEDFMITVKQEILNYLGDDYHIEFKHIIKNNGIILDGILIRNEEERVCPTIYLNPYYDKYCKGTSLREVVEEILSAYEGSCDESRELELNFKYDFEEMKELITFRLVNYEKNHLLLTTVPHLRLFDLAITFHCIIRMDGDGIGSVRITNEHCKNWKVEKKELFELAMVNTQRLFPAVLRPMEEVVFDLIGQQEMLEMDQEELHGASNMYVLTNEKGINGASCILYPNILKDFHKRLGMDYFILPSSIHEVILVPENRSRNEESRVSLEQLENMVREINETQVATEDVLSNRVYSYPLIQDKLE